MTIDEFKRDLAKLTIKKVPDVISTEPPRRDEYGHFPGCYRVGCAATRCQWPL